MSRPGLEDAACECYQSMVRQTEIWKSESKADCVLTESLLIQKARHLAAYSAIPLHFARRLAAAYQRRRHLNS